MTKEEVYLIESAAPDTPFRVLQYSNPLDYIVLRKKSTDISDLKNDVKNDVNNKEQLNLLIARMKTTLEHEMGVGLAAPQIGISRNVFLFVRVDKPDKPVEVAINPRIVKHPDFMVCFEGDGCLSIENISGDSMRYPWVEVEYINEEGQLIRERLEGYSRADNFVAVIFQHEYDHLHGRLFIDKLCK